MSVSMIDEEVEGTKPIGQFGVHPEEFGSGKYMSVDPVSKRSGKCCGGDPTVTLIRYLYSFI